MLLHLADRIASRPEKPPRRRDSVARPRAIIPPDAFRRFSRDSSLAALENFQTTRRSISSRREFEHPCSQLGEQARA